MQTLNVQLNQTEAAKTQVQTQKIAKLSGSGDGDFKSILESVKSEGKVEKKPSTRADDFDKSNESKPLAKSEADEPKSSINNTESAAAKETADKKVENPVEEIAEKTPESTATNENTEKINAGVAKTLLKDALNVSEKNSEKENELTVEIDAESMELNAEALGVALQNAVTANETENIPVQDNMETETNVLAVAETVKDDLELVPADTMIASEIESEVVETAAINAGEELALKPEIPSDEKPVETSVVEPLSENVQPVAQKPDVEKKAEVKNQLADSSSRTEKKDEATFKITDLRGSESKEEKKIPSSEKVVAQNESVKVQEDAASSLMKTAQANILASDNQSAGASGSTFQQMLSQQIQYNAPEFAKAGNIILRDNNSGSINMILKPENLGNVKISLELSDKIINGQIVVHSKEAFEAFKQNLDTLRQAFRNNGFDNANFNLSLADSGTGNFSQGRDETGAQFMANKTYNNYAGSDEVVQPQSESTAYTTSDDYHVDVVA